MNLKALIATGKWEEYFLDGKNRLEKSLENYQAWLNMEKHTMKWVLVAKEKPLISQKHSVDLAELYGKV